ncbi:uncharacterized protein DUF4333 [Pseudonocardia sediminis]|uniref:Uncharacterized protein DUF4333 n=1 Tax=Pseudonocardia sediminis TaxID=1397368 RepID=A0A4Q7UZ66_PSEST|nr:DUF4333 domain-containing protein [Pseudonocardia sediminis]RZT86408.1 uncharacterized protein DUF4333 [Pseudonocardia sediminis]
MSTPQGPDRQGRHPSDAEQTGELPTWGTPPPGGWGQADPDAPGRDDDLSGGPQGGRGAEATGGWAPTGGAGSTGVWEQTGGAGSTGAWAPAGGAQETGGWAPAASEGTGGWPSQPGGRRRAEDRVPDQPGYAGRPGYDDSDWAPSPWDQPAAPRSDVPAGRAPVWGDESTAVAAPAGGRRRAPDDDAGAGPTGVWGPTDDGVLPGEEPWAPDDVVRRPKRGPLGLGRGALVGIVGGVVVIAVLLVLAFVAPGFAVTRTLDKTALQNGVNQILSQNYRLQVGAIDCPDDVEVTAGTTFECQAVVDGEQLAVPGRVITDDGAYQVGRV